jgi:hypothetical protein
MPILRADYARLREMIFGDAPTWEQIIQNLRELENLINRKKNMDRSVSRPLISPLKPPI